MKNPIQPFVTDKHGTLRFKANTIVQHLLDTHPTCDMNKLACMDFTDDDRQQFAQLIGYSLSGYSELRSYVDDQAYATAVKLSNSQGMTNAEARIAVLEEEIADLREAASALRGPVAVLLGMHPDNLI